MISLLKFIFTTISILLLCSHLAAQSNGPKKSTSDRPSDEGPKLRGENLEETLTLSQQNALLTLNRLFDMTKDFEDAQLKIRVQARIADILWKYD